MNDDTAGSLEAFISSEDDVLTIRERFLTDAIISFTSHQDRMSCCQPTKTFEVFWEMPRHCTIESDRSILSHGNDCGELNIHRIKQLWVQECSDQPRSLLS